MSGEKRREREGETKFIADHKIMAAAEETFPDAAATALGSMFIVQDNKITLKAFFAGENIFLFSFCRRAALSEAKHQSVAHVVSCDVCSLHHHSSCVSLTLFFFFVNELFRVFGARWTPATAPDVQLSR